MDLYTDAAILSAEAAISVTNRTITVPSKGLTVVILRALCMILRMLKACTFVGKRPFEWIAGHSGRMWKHNKQ